MFNGIYVCANYVYAHKINVRSTLFCLFSIIYRTIILRVQHDVNIVKAKQIDCIF